MKIHRNDHRPAPQPVRRGQSPRPAAQTVPAAVSSPPSHREAPSRGRGWISTMLLVVFAVTFLVSAGVLVKRLWEDRQAENEFAALQEMIVTDTPSAAPDTENNLSIRFASLKEYNDDFLGWITIEGTKLDLPVMHTGTDRPDYYLRRDFNGEYSVYGVPYLEEECTVSAERTSENLVIYGHNMKTGTIFGCLTGYKQASYYQEHPFIEFNTLYFEGTYEVFAAFAIDVVEDTSFVYNRYIDLDEAAFNSYVSQVIARSDVDTGITPVYGDQLLTLSTCEYSTDNGRYVVVARRVGA